MRNDPEHLIPGPRGGFCRCPGLALPLEQRRPLVLQAPALGDVAHSPDDPHGAPGLVADDPRAVGHVGVVAVPMEEPVDIEVAGSAALEGRPHGRPAPRQVVRMHTVFKPPDVRYDLIQPKAQDLLGAPEQLQAVRNRVPVVEIAGESLSGISKAFLAQLEGRLDPLPLGDIEVDAQQPRRSVVGSGDHAHAGGDPSDGAVGQDHAVFVVDEGIAWDLGLPVRGDAERVDGGLDPRPVIRVQALEPRLGAGRHVQREPMQTVDLRGPYDAAAGQVPVEDTDPGRAFGELASLLTRLQGCVRGPANVRARGTGGRRQ